MRTRPRIRASGPFPGRAACRFRSRCRRARLRREPGRPARNKLRKESFSFLLKPPVEALTAVAGSGIPRSVPSGWQDETMSALLADLKYSARALVKSPGFTVVAL